MSKKLIGIIASFALVLSLVGASTASALTASDIAMLQAAGIISASQAASLSASIAAPTTSTGYTFSKDLQLGSRGDDVKALQSALGVSPVSGYFGPLTKAALIKYQLSKGITPAAGYFGPKTRASFGSVVSSGGTVVVASGTDLKVSLAATSPAAAAIVAGQAAANLAEFTFTNTSATPAVVTNVTLARTGVSADTSLSNVYLYNGAVRLTDAATVSSGKISFNASTGLFTIPAGMSYTVAVKADISTGAAAGQIIAVSLTGVTANVPVAAVYPVAGASMTVASAGDIATMTLGAVSNPVASGSTINVQAGTMGQTIWASALNITQRAVYLKSLALKVIGSIPTNTLQNVKLFVGGVQVSQASGVDSLGMLTFDLTAQPYKIDSSRTLEVRADVVNGSSRSFSVSLQNNADIQVYDSNYNVGIAAASGVPASTGNIAVSTGSVTVTQDTSLAAGNIVTGSSNVPLARYTFKAYGEDMKISYLNVASTDQLDNVALYANGVQIGSTQTISATTTLGALTPSSANLKLFNIGSSLIIPAGTSVTVEVRADIKYNGTNLSTTANTVQVGLVGYTNNAQGSYSQQLVTVPSAEQDGVIMTVTGAGLTVAKNSGYATSQTVNPNTTGVKLGSYVFQAGSAEAIRITSLTVNLGGAAGVYTNVSNLRLAYGSNSTTPINPSSSGSNNFSVDFTVPANGSVIVDVYGDLGSVQGAATTSLPVTTGVSGYGVSSNITVSNSVAVTGQTVTSGQGSISTVARYESTSPVAQLVVGQTTSKIVDFNFVSVNGASTISEMYFDITGPITSLTVGGTSFPVVGASTTANGLNVNIPVGNAGTNVPVLATYANVGLNGVASMQSASVLLTGYKYTSGNNTQTVTGGTATTSYSMVVVGSKPTLAVAGNGDVGAGFKTLAKISVSADAAGPVSLINLPLSIITTTGSTVSGMDVYVNGSSIASQFTGAFTAATGTTATGTLVFNSGTGYQIAAGQTVVFSVMANVAGNYNNGDTIQTSLGSKSLFTWSDVNGNATTTGANIFNYPTAAGVVTF